MRVQYEPGDKDRDSKSFSNACTGFVCHSMELQPSDIDAMIWLLENDNPAYLRKCLLQLKNRFRSVRLGGDLKQKR